MSTQDTTCWICRRNVTELPSELYTKTREEQEIVKLITKVTDQKAHFEIEMKSWQHSLPQEYSGFDLSFVLENADQFKKLAEHSPEIEELRKHGAEIETAVNQMRDDNRSALGEVKFSDETSIIDYVNRFEGKEGHSLLDIKSLSFIDGVSYLSRLGQFYYDLQLSILNDQLTSAGRKRKRWAAYGVNLGDGGREVTLCTVCDQLIRKLAESEAKKAAIN